MRASQCGVSPDGSRVFVTGASFRSTDYDHATVAYDMSSGGRLWVGRYNGKANGNDFAAALG